MGGQSEAGATARPELRIPDPATMPWPGDELIYRVTGFTDRTTFYNSGHQSVQDLEAVLASVGRSLSTFSTILDFGSGCGRIALWLEHLAPTSAVHGSDIDARAIAWAQDNIPWAEFKVNQPLPPLDYPDGHFDLVFSHSVFTHIDEHYQDRWLTELRRVVKPGGYAILSVHGETAFTVFEEAVANRGGDPSVIRRELSSRGISFIKDDAFTGGPFPDFYHSTFHAPWYVFEHWARWFTVAAFLPKRSMNYQDFVLLQRPLGDVAVDGGRPVRPGWLRQRAVETDRAGRCGDPGGHRRGDGGERPLPRRPAAARRRRPGRGPAPGAAGEAGPAGGGAAAGHPRRPAPLNIHQQEVDRALFTALWELDSSVAASTRSGGVPLTELNGRLWDAIRLQGERLNRLESDLWTELQGHTEARNGAQPDPTDSSA